MAVPLKNTYPLEPEVKKYLTFAAPPSRGDVNIILQQRVAAWLRDHNLVARNCFGYRSTADQARLYKAWLAYKDYKANPKTRTAVPKASPAAPPGTSWHEFHGAVDLQGPGIQEYVERAILPFGRNNQTCNKWGISFTMNKIDAPTQLEWWHVVLLESANYKGDRSKFF